MPSEVPREAQALAHMWAEVSGAEPVSEASDCKVESEQCSEPRGDIGVSVEIAT